MTRLPDDGAGHVVAGQRAVEQAGAWRADGLVVVLATGSFDLLLAADVRYLAAAKSEGDRLIVVVDDDETVRAASGPERPVHPSDERAELIAALQAVDLVTVSGQSARAALIASLQPDVVVTTSDELSDARVGGEVVQAYGGRVVCIPTDPGQSATALIARIRQQN